MDRSDPFGRSCFGKAEGELNLPLAAFHEGHPQSRESSIQGRQTSPEGRHAHRLDHDAGSPESGTVVRACGGVRVWALAEVFQFWRGIMRLKTSSAQKDVR